MKNREGGVGNKVMDKKNTGNRRDIVGFASAVRTMGNGAISGTAEICAECTIK